ncbi:MAG: hypothetical protein ACI33K_14435 [Clostridiaceae bacterium]
MKGMILLMNYFYRINERRQLTRAMIIGFLLGSAATIAITNLLNRSSYYHDNNESYMNDEGEVDITIETFPENTASSKATESQESYITLSTPDTNV